MGRGKLLERLTSQVGDEGLAIAILKKRGHLNPTYSLNELRDWLFSQDEFHKIYDEWVESGYDRWKRPSCDRLDDYKPYSLDNMRIVSWRDNWGDSTHHRRNRHS